MDLDIKGLISKVKSLDISDAQLRVSILSLVYLLEILKEYRADGEFDNIKDLDDLDWVEKLIKSSIGHISSYFGASSDEDTYNNKTLKDLFGVLEDIDIAEMVGNTTLNLVKDRWGV